MTKRRWVVLQGLLNKKKPEIGAEIGIQRGKMTIEMLKRLPSIITYYAIDPWLWYPDYKKSVKIQNQKKWDQTVMNRNYNFFLNEINDKGFKKKVKVLRMTGENALKEIPDNSLDFIFIDGNHSYEYVKKDCEMYLPKIKKGGLMSGHDYGLSSGQVDKAVNEVFGSDKISLGPNRTWWIWI